MSGGTSLHEYVKFLGRPHFKSQRVQSLTMSGRSLALLVDSKTIMVPDVQRTLDVEKVESIIRTFEEKQAISQDCADDYMYTLGAIHIAVIPCDKTDAKFGAVAASTRRGKRQSFAMFLVVDGQHRLHVLRQLLHKSVSNVFSMHIEVIVKLCDTHQQVEEWFHELNQSTPLPNYLKMSQTSKVQHRFIRAMKAKLEPLQPYFSKKKSAKATSYHWDEWLDDALKLDTLFEDLLQRNTVEHTINDTEINKLCTEVMEQLIYISNQCREQLVHDVTVRKIANVIPSTPSTRKKILMDEAYFVLALKNIKDWRDMLWNENHSPRIEAIVKSTYKKNPISTSMRMNVWQKYHPTVGIAESVECPIPGCTHQIAQRNFHCAHKIAEAKGGSTTLDNLIPLCSHCNCAMGTKSYAEYEEERRIMLGETSDVVV